VRLLAASPKPTMRQIPMQSLNPPGFQTVAKVGGSFLAPGESSGKGLSVHGKTFGSQKEKMAHLRSLRKK
jgi:hypothetical protein